MLITPYGDPNAHGSIGRTLTFIRRRGIVYVRPYKIPFDPRSVSQLAQRDLFRDAIAGWYALSSESKDYWNLIASGQSYTGYNIYISHFMNGTLPSVTPQQVSDITNSWIGNLRATVSNGWKYAFTPNPPGANFGTINDNANSYSDGVVHSPALDLKVVVSRIAQDINIELKDTVMITYDVSQTLTIFLPSMDSPTVLFVAQDGSTYYDSSMLQLAACA